MNYLDNTIPEVKRDDLCAPLTRLSGELMNEMQRDTSGVVGRPPAPLQVADLRALALACVDLLKDGKMRVADARRFVAEALTGAGVSTTHKQVKQYEEWIELQDDQSGRPDGLAPPKGRRALRLAEMRAIVNSGKDRQEIAQEWLCKAAHRTISKKS